MTTTPALSEPATPQPVQVTVLLSGGQEYQLALSPDAPLLRQLFEVMLDQSGTRAKLLFQVPLQDGRAMLSFPGDRLVGVVTEPPLVVQQPSQAAQAQASPNLPSDLPSYYIQIDHFLSDEQLQDLLNYTLQREPDFVSTSTSTGDDSYRKSVVLQQFPEYASLFIQCIREIVPQVVKTLELPEFEIASIEAQLTGHNDGNYYKIHNDNGSPDTATRELTYVYYFYREPKAFSGGELRIYDSRIENNYYVQADSFHTIEPRNNSIVFFLSRYMHEVLPIQCPSRAFADSRFTVNGWVRRA